METQGTRVQNMDAVWEGEPGYYYPTLNGAGEVTALWFKLPTGSLGRIANIGHGQGDDPEWTITLNEDGTVTVDPSIEQHEIPDHAPYWHGHLVGGVWRD